MYKTLRFVLLVASLVSLSPLAMAKDFKGSQESPDLALGVVSGFGLLGPTPTFPIHLTISKRIIPSGPVEDINNSLHAELEAGPSFIFGTAIYFSAHARWDFVKDDKFTLSALAGLSGIIASPSVFMTPRFGLGGFYRFQKNMALRAIAANDLFGLGITFLIF